MAQRVDLDYIKANADFAAVLAVYGVQVPKGKMQFKVNCPFHDDKRPSLSINLKSKVFRCFTGSCGASGNLFKFVELADQKIADARAAGMRVAEICCIDVAPAGRNDVSNGSQRLTEREKGKDDSSGGSETMDAIEELVEAINPPLTFTLTSLDQHHAYLEGRGLDQTVIEEFGLGYASRGMMKGRIAIPIHDADGELVGYAGRWADGDDTMPENADKYLLPSRKKGFYKSHLLFNLHRVTRRFKNHRRLVIVEGYWPVFRLWPMGVPVVSIMGSSMSDEQIALLAHLPDLKLVTLLMDGDDAGRGAVASIAPWLAEKYAVYAPRLPDNEQPDTIDAGLLEQLIKKP